MRNLFRRLGSLANVTSPGENTLFGSTVIDLGFITISGQRTLGYKRTEQILRLDEPVYVLGLVNDDHTINAAPDGVKDKPFMISYRSEEDLTTHLQSQHTMLRIWTGICAAVGVVLLIIAVVWR